MRRSILLAVAICAAAVPAVAQSDRLLTELEAYRTRSGAIDWAAVQRDVSRRESAKAKPAPVPAPVIETAAAAMGAPAGKPVAAPKPTVNVFLRQGFSDVGLFDKPSEAFGAKGAAFGWQSDRVLDDSAWSVNGMAAVALSIPGDYAAANQPLGIIGVSVVPYVQLNRETHSRLIKKNSDTSIVGASVEVGLDAQDAGRHYLRFSGARVEDDIANTTSSQWTAEWLPVSADLCLGYPCALLPPAATQAGLPQLIYRLSPELKLQHDRMSSAGTVFFSGERDATRLGPEVSFKVQPFARPADDGSIFDVNKLAFSTTYHWDREFNSGDSFHWLETALIYNMDKAGHWGVTLSYKNGNEEDTGKKTDLTKLSFTAKY